MKKITIDELIRKDKRAERKFTPLEIRLSNRISNLTFEVWELKTIKVKNDDVVYSIV